MKVRDLVEALQKMDPELEVWEDTAWTFIPATSPYVGWLAKRLPDGDWFAVTAPVGTPDEDRYEYKGPVCLMT